MTQLTRRELMQYATAVLAMSALPALEGCPAVTQSQLAELIGEVGAGLAEILPYLKTVSSSAAATIYQAFQALETAVQNWKPGGVVSEIEQAVNAFVSAMSLVPVLAEYQPLVALIVATVEGLLTLLIPISTTASNVVAGMPKGVIVTHEKGRVIVAVNGVTIANPPTTAGKFRSAWNKQVGANAKLSGSALS
jgi:hypothetical protein